MKLGADVAINYQTEDFVAAVKEATGGRGADVILDMVGGDYVARNYEAAAEDGRIVQIATQKGARGEVDLHRMMVKRLTHTGSTLRIRPVAFKAAVATALHRKCLAAARGAEGRARDRLDLSPRPRRGRPCPHGERRTFRQDHADGQP